MIFLLYRGKRDGLSKEGSGRVAIYKSTGLIKCYTLECNYNTGKYVNVLPARGKDKAPRAVNLVPPKYTPAIFEEVSEDYGILYFIFITFVHFNSGWACLGRFNTRFDQLEPDLSTTQLGVSDFAGTAQCPAVEY